MARKTKKNWTPKDHYKTITDAIIAALEAGVAPWTCPWDRTLGMSRNGASGNVYKGINTWLTFAAAWAAGYQDPRWYTFNQAKERGGSVRGQHGIQIVHWRFVVPKRKADETDEEFDARKHRKVPILSVWTVFNHEQVTWEDPEKEPKLTDAEPVDITKLHAEAAEFLATCGANIKHGGARAFYDPKKDRIGLPPVEAFKTPEDYFCTAFHEVIHWTGAEGRCDRDLKGRFGTESYAAEELVAELGAAFLCADYAIEGKLQHPEYIGHWLKVLKGDKYAVFTAARLARDAANFTKVKPVENTEIDPVQTEVA